MSGTGRRALYIIYIKKKSSWCIISCNHWLRSFPFYINIYVSLWPPGSNPRRFLVVDTFPVEVVTVSWHVLPPSDHWYSQLQFLEFLSLWSSTSHFYDDSVLSYDIQHEKEYISNMCLCIDCVYRHMLINWISVHYFAASNLVKSMHCKCTFSYLTDIFLYTLSPKDSSALTVIRLGFVQT